MQLQKFLKPAAASLLLLFAGNAALHAGHSGKSALGIAPVGETAPVSTVEVSGIDPAAAPGHASREREFSYLINTARAAGREYGMASDVLFNHGELLITGTSAVQTAGFAQPIARAAQNIEILNPPVTIDGRTFNRAVTWSWGGAQKLAWMTHGRWSRALNFKVRYLKTSGNAYLAFRGRSSENLAVAESVVTFRGLPQAGASVKPASIRESGGARTVSVACSLSRPADAPTLCTLGIAAASTATPNSDYTVSPAIAGAAITVPAGATSASKNFTITPVVSGDGGVIELELTHAVSGGAEIARDAAPAVFTIHAPNLLFSEQTSASIDVSEGGGGPRRLIWLKLGALPRGGDVVVDITVDDPGEARTTKSQMTFTAGNWSEPQAVRVLGVDDDFDDGDKPFTVTFAVRNNETADEEYHGLGITRSGITADDDTAEISIAAAPAFLTEDAGAQSVRLTARLGGGPGGDVVLLEEDAEITLARKTSGAGAGTAAEGVDYAAFTPPSITIRAGEDSGFADISIQPVADDAADNGETIVIAAEYESYEIPDFAIPIREFALQPGELFGLATEAGGAATFSLALPTEPGGEVVVQITSSDPSEAAVSPSELIFTPGNWNRPRRVAVAGVHDDFDDGDVQYTIGISVVNHRTDDSNYHGRSASLAGATVDDDTAVITVAAEPEFLTESEGLQSVELTAAIAGDVRLERDAVVVLAIPARGGGTATQGVDYTVDAAPPRLTIRANTASASAAFIVTTIPDDDEDDNETIVITAALPPYTIAPLALRIREFALETSQLIGGVGESGKTAFFTLQLTTRPESGNVVVNIRSSDPSEAAVRPSQVVFPSDQYWAQRRYINVTGRDDLFDDGDKPFTIELEVDDGRTADPNYHGLNAEVSGVNEDDDHAEIVLTASPPFLKEAGGAQRADITAELRGDVRLEEETVIALAVGGSATAGADYETFTPPALTIAPGAASTSAEITITPAADEIADSGETITFTAAPNPSAIAPLQLPIREFALRPRALSNATTEAPGGFAVFSLALPSPPQDLTAGDVVVDVVSADPGEAAVSPSRLVFTAKNWNRAQQVIVRGVDDRFDDGAQDYAIRLLVNAPRTADRNYHGAAASVAGRNLDDDTARITLAVNSPGNGGGGYLVESGGAQSVAVTAALQGEVRLEEEAVITLAVGGGATPNADYDSFTPPTLTLAAGAASASATFTVTPRDDGEADNDETMVFTATLAPYAIPPAQLLIREFALQFGELSGDTYESGGAPASFALGLTAPPSGDVVVTARSNDPGEAVVAPEITFTPDDWRLRRVNVTGVDDNFDDGDKAYAVALEVDDDRTADPNYRGLGVKHIVGRNIDDDTARITLAASPDFLIEDAPDGMPQNVTITVALHDGVLLEEDAAITLSLGRGTATAGDDYAAFTLPKISIPAGQASASAAIAVSTVADNIADSGETVSIAAAAAPPYAAREIAALQLPIREYALQPGALSGDTRENRPDQFFTLALPTKPSGNVVLTFASSDEGEAVVSPSELRFTPRNWHIARRLSVSGVDDLFDDGKQPYTIGFAADDAKTEDPNYRGRSAELAGANEDDDTAEITLSADRAFLNKADGAQRVTFTVALRGAVRFENEVEIALALSGGDAVAGSDYESFTLPASVAIPANTAAAAPVVVEITPAAAAVNGRTIGLTAALDGYQINPLALPIRAFELLAGELSGQTTEAGGQAVFQVWLSSAPALAGNVIVQITGSDPGEAAVSPAELVFNAVNWNERRAVTVTGVDDPFDDGDQNYDITLAVDAARTADPNYRRATGRTLSGVNTDDDEATIAFTADTEFLLETGGRRQPVVITVALGGGAALETAATFTLAKSGAAEEGVDYAAFALPELVIPANTASASASATLQISPIDDGEPDSGETIILSAASPALASLGLSLDDLTLKIRGFELDVDASGKLTAQDGILTARNLLGVTGDALTAGQTATAADAVAANIAVGLKDGTGELDLNGDNRVNGDDGVLVARYLLGLRGAALAAGISGADAAAVRARMEALQP